MSAAKFVVYLGLFFCGFQEIRGYVPTTTEMLEKINYEAEKNVLELQHVVAIDTLGALFQVKMKAHNLADSAKGSFTNFCISILFEKSKLKLNRARSKINSCVESLKDSFLTYMADSTSLDHTMPFQDKFRKEILNCKQKGIEELKTIVEAFQSQSKTCFLNLTLLDIVKTIFN